MVGWFCFFLLSEEEEGEEDDVRIERNKHQVYFVILITILFLFIGIGDMPIICFCGGFISTYLITETDNHHHNNNIIGTTTATTTTTPIRTSFSEQTLTININIISIISSISSITFVINSNCYVRHRQQQQ